MYLTIQNSPSMKYRKRILLTIVGLFAALCSNAQIPTLEWVNGLTSQTRFVKTSSIKTDRMGYIYSSGYFEGIVDFDPGPDVLNINSTLGSVFISKFNSIIPCFYSRWF